MSIKLMSVVWQLVLPDSEKLAFLALADSANDEGLCWPSMATLSRKCSKSDRTVQKAIQSLVERGHMSREERPGRGVLYLIHPRSDCTPEATAPPKAATLTPEAASDNPSRNIKSPQSPPTQVERDEHETGTEAGDQYWQGMKGRSWADTGPMLRELKKSVRARRAAKPQRGGASGKTAHASQDRKYPHAIAKKREDQTSGAIHDELRLRLGEADYGRWIAPLALIYDAPGITVFSTTISQHSYIEDRYQPLISKVALQVIGRAVS